MSLLAEPYSTLIRSHAHGRLLDLGCGPVPYWPIYRELVTENYCVDWPDSLHENVHLDLAVDLNQAIPLPDQSFDTILCTDVLEHIHQPQQLLGEMARLLKPGGKALITTPFLYRIHEEPHDYFRYTEFAFQAMTRKAGLEIVHLVAYGGYPDVLLDLLFKGLQNHRRLLGVLVPLARWLSRSSFFLRLRQRTARKYPLGYCLAAQKPH